MYSLLSADDYHIVFLIHINPGVANIRFSEIFKWIIGLQYTILQNIIMRKRSCETHRNVNWIARV